MPPIYVFDTYATCANGRTMHFDVVLTEKDPAKALARARDWLGEIGEGDAVVKEESCCYCHGEAAAPPALAPALESRGYAIVKLEGCR